MTICFSSLSNGLRVATDPMPEAESVTFGAWVDVGARSDPGPSAGLAHFAEHMFFKGTKRRSAYGLSDAIEKKGGMMNAYTTREETAYYARVLPEDAELAVDVIADMLQHSVFAPKELAREQKVVLQEIGRDKDSPEDYIHDLFYETAFPDQRMGRSVLGTERSVSNLSREKLAAYVDRHYHAGNIVLVATGKIEHAQTLALAQSYFGKLKQKRKTKVEQAKIKGGENRFKRESEQLHMMFAFPAPDVHSRLAPAAALLGILLGGSSSSRLFQSVREKRGLVYHISASHMAFRDTGFLGISAGTDPTRAKELMPVLCRELQEVTRRVTPAELRRAKAQARADILMGRESVMRRAETLGHQILAFGRPCETQKRLDKIDRVTEKETASLAARLFSRRPILTTLGDAEGLDSYGDILRRLA